MLLKMVKEFKTRKKHGICLCTLTDLKYFYNDSHLQYHIT